jgi:hypothetical protein
MNDALLGDVKNYLDITWTDADTDSKLNGIIVRARSILQKYAGCDLAFSDESEKQLLFDCVRYIYSNAYEEFGVNFAGELIALRARHAVEEAEEAEDPDET